MLLNALVKGESIEKIIEKYGSKRLKKKKEEVKAPILGALGEADIIELKICLENINRLKEQIRQLNAKIATPVNKKDIERISKVPGIGEVSASAMIAEIADPKRFQNEKKLYSWSGLAPSTYQSAGKTAKTGHMTKRGSKWLRRILVQCTTPGNKNTKQPNQAILPKNKGKERPQNSHSGNGKKTTGHNMAPTHNRRRIHRQTLRKKITKSRKKHSN